MSSEWAVLTALAIRSHHPLEWLLDERSARRFMTVVLAPWVVRQKGVAHWGRHCSTCTTHDIPATQGPYAW